MLNKTQEKIPIFLKNENIGRKERRKKEGKNVGRSVKILKKREEKKEV
jgi:hypothetical protein